MFFLTKHTSKVQWWKYFINKIAKNGRLYLHISHYMGNNDLPYENKNKQKWSSKHLNNLTQQCLIYLWKWQNSFKGKTAANTHLEHTVGSRLVCGTPINYLFSEKNIRVENNFFYGRGLSLCHRESTYWWSVFKDGNNNTFFFYRAG